MSSLTVSMPAYNEAANIAEMIELVKTRTANLTDDLEIIVVDDGSKDSTADVVREIAQRDRRVRLIEHARNQGYGAAVADGVWAASKALIFFTDSDLQFDLQELPRFMSRLDEADMIVGYRYERSDPWYRTLFGNGWSWLVNLMFGYTARDIDCAFKLFRREIIEQVQVGARGATFSAEFLVRAKRAGFRLVEAPVSHYPRKAGRQTGANIRVIARAFRELFKLRVGLWREPRPARRHA